MERKSSRFRFTVKCFKWTHPSSQVLGDQRHQQAGRRQQRAPLRHQLHVHETHLTIVTGQSQRVHARIHTLQTKHNFESQETEEHSHTVSHTDQHTHLGIAPEEAIGDGDVDVKGQCLQDAGLCGDKLLPLVCIVADIKEVVDTGRTALLQENQSRNVRSATADLNRELYTARPYLKLGGNEHGSGADELQKLPVDWSLGQVVVCHLNGQVQGLMVQLKVLLNKGANQILVSNGAATQPPLN